MSTKNRTGKFRSHPVFRNFILHDKRLKINKKTKKISAPFWLRKESANPPGKRKISIYKEFRMCYYVCGEDWALDPAMQGFPLGKALSSCFVFNRLSAGEKIY